MKRVLSFVYAFTMLVALTACSGQGGVTAPSSSRSAGTQETQTQKQNNSRQTSESGSAQPEKSATVLVAYFSATGHTKALAEYAADAMKADLYEIVPEKPYTSEDLDYGDNNSRSSAEQNDENARPAISGQVDDMQLYDVVFLGYPIWWGEAPRILYTFMEAYDFSGKTVVPFCTSGSSGIGSSAEHLHALVSPDVTWLEGERLDAGSTRADIVNWINGLGLEITAE